jgi:hypothetical protein
MKLIRTFVHGSGGRLIDFDRQSFLQNRRKNDEEILRVWELGPRAEDRRDEIVELTTISTQTWSVRPCHSLCGSGRRALPPASNLLAQ